MKIPPDQGQPNGAGEVIPCNIDAEQHLLGAILLRNNVYDTVDGIVRPPDFYEAVHGRIFESIQIRIKQNQPANPITLRLQFGQDPDLRELVGEGNYLDHLVKLSIGGALAVEYATTIRDMAILRNLIALGHEISALARIGDPTNPPTKQITKAESELYQLAETGRYEGGFKKFDSALADAVKIAAAAHSRDGQLAGIPTYLADLDAKLGGLHRSDLIILAGRPSMGKTALAANIAFAIARNFKQESDSSGAKRLVAGGIVGFFSLEMSSEQLATRILAEQCGVSSEKIRRGMLNTPDYRRLAEVAQELETVPLYIDDTAALSLSAIAARARRLKRQYGLDVIVIDYLQLLHAMGRFRNHENRVQELTEITQGLKSLAKDLDIPVIALSQLSRQVEIRENKRPQLADLRESGSIEQDSDVVMFIYRQEYYDARKEPAPNTSEHRQWQENMAKIYNKAEIIIAKHRHGPIGSVELHFDAMLTRFSNLAKPSSLPDKNPWPDKNPLAR